MMPHAPTQYQMDCYFKEQAEQISFLRGCSRTALIAALALQTGTLISLGVHQQVVSTVLSGYAACCLIYAVAVTEWSMSLQKELRESRSAGMTTEDAE